MTTDSTGQTAAIWKTRKLHYLLESAHQYWQEQWNTVWAWFGNDEFNLVVWGSVIVTILIFWIPGICFLAIDLSGKPKCLQKYRIQKISEYQKMTCSEVWRDSKQIIYNQLVCGALMALLFYHAVIWRGCDTRNVPAFSRIIADLAFIVLLQEIVFYYLHRFMHTPFMFRHIHYLHHKWETPIAITANFCHPIEHVLANTFPIILGPVILGSHLVTAWLWFCLSTVSTLILHSGFHILQFPNPEVHDLHHSKRNKNYGVIGLMDRLHGTIEFPKRTST